MLASHRQKRNPRPSAWLSLHLRSPVPGCVVFLVVFLEESSWDMAWVASPVPANSPVILDGEKRKVGREEKLCQWKTWEGED